MMQRDGRGFVVICDECGEELETGVDEFADAKEAMKDADWSAHIDNKSWNHRCPACDQGVR